MFYCSIEQLGINIILDFPKKKINLLPFAIFPLNLCILKISNKNSKALSF
jgi:hypothetical protein